jgi:hypothetical protein
METSPCFSEAALQRLRTVGGNEPRLAALYAFDVEQRENCSVAVVFTETPPWSDRLNLELAVSDALELEALELINLRRMSLISRYDIINRGEPIYVGDPEALAVFIEETIVRYSAFYPLLEALYWRVETRPTAEDKVGQNSD